jgi:hypothetical protein
LHQSVVTDFVRTVESALERAADWLRSALGYLGHAVFRLGHLAISLASGVWSHSAYAVLNLAALVLMTAMLVFAVGTGFSSRLKSAGGFRFLGLDLLALILLGASLVLVEKARGIWSHGLGVAVLGAEIVGLFALLTYQLYVLDSIDEAGAGADAASLPADPESWSTGASVEGPGDAATGVGWDAPESGRYLVDPPEEPAVPGDREPVQPAIG